jgi:hypothetical protein
MLRASQHCTHVARFHDRTVLDDQHPVARLSEEARSRQINRNATPVLAHNGLNGSRIRAWMEMSSGEAGQVIAQTSAIGG